jgi:hypothetical protein
MFLYNNGKSERVQIQAVRFLKIKGSMETLKRLHSDEFYHGCEKTLVRKLGEKTNAFVVNVRGGGIRKDHHILQVQMRGDWTRTRSRAGAYKGEQLANVMTGEIITKTWYDLRKAKSLERKRMKRASK